ncbi:endolytic transglycosylase MltG [Leadbetterella byssophila]|uniref:endolytic transglycosylase MltG n=1 Tax=Leadbetterella byssophila TaxID=316068 RepID=UPI00399FFCF8
MTKKRKLFTYFLVLFSTVAASFAFYLWQVYSSPNLNVDGKETFVLYIPEGSDYNQVLDSLRSHNIIHNEIAFGFLTKRKGYREEIKAGRYEIPPNSSNNTIISKLLAGRQDPVKLTFNNIRTKEDLVRKIGSRLAFNGEELLAKLRDEDTANKYGFTSETFMNMFLPDTYFIYWTVTPDAFLDRMHSEYKKFWTEERKAKAESIALSPDQVSILASIVQSETNKKDEMPVVAGVYMNRLRIGMPLQADPTVKFAVGDFSLKRILHKHLSIDSPYNTYKNTGLPPGPIALPERVALDAVLNYQKHNYTYFSAKEDFSGYHNFAENFNEHIKNAQRYQTALNQRGIR